MTLLVDGVGVSVSVMLGGGESVMLLVVVLSDVRVRHIPSEEFCSRASLSMPPIFPPCECRGAIAPPLPPALLDLFLISVSSPSICFFRDNPLKGYFTGLATQYCCHTAKQTNPAKRTDKLYVRTLCIINHQVPINRCTLEAIGARCNL